MNRRFFETTLSVLAIVLGFALSVAVVLTKPAPAFAQQGNQLIVLTANWCANCRSMIPIVQDTARQNRMSVTLIDVDQQSAPKQAKEFGIPILSRDLPQVFLVSPSGTRLVLEGKNYTYGDDELVRSDLLQALK